MSFFFNDTATTEIYTLSLHDALPIWHGTAWTLLGAAGGLMLGLALRAGGGRGADAAEAESVNFPLTLDLLRRAHDGRAGWAIGLADGPIEAVGSLTSEEQGAEPRRRGAAFVQLASV